MYAHPDGPGHQVCPWFNPLPPDRHALRAFADLSHPPEAELSPTLSHPLLPTSQVLYGKEPTTAELMEVKPVIHANIINTMKAIISEAPRLGTDDKILDQDQKKKMLEMDDDEALNPERGAIVKAMWADPGVQATWDLRAEYQVVESISKFFDEVDIIAADDYCPTSQHMLTARVRTSGIVTESYQIDGNTFEMYDVGGQRNERKKWIHCFDNVTAVIFVGAISEYNQKLFEDTSTNRMKEALDLYEEIAHNNYFEKASILLFLNKKDLFEEKIAKVPISDTPDFADYTGGAFTDRSTRCCAMLCHSEPRLVLPVLCDCH